MTSEMVKIIKITKDGNSQGICKTTEIFERLVGLVFGLSSDERILSLYEPRIGQST